MNHIPYTTCKDLYDCHLWASGWEFMQMEIIFFILIIVWTTGISSPQTRTGILELHEISNSYLRLLWFIKVNTQVWRDSEFQKEKEGIMHTYIDSHVEIYFIYHRSHLLKCTMHWFLVYLRRPPLLCNSSTFYSLFCPSLTTQQQLIWILSLWICLF
jgi:hypothetical protein